MTTMATERCVVCREIFHGEKPIARADDGPICTEKCWRAFMFGSNLLAKIKNFSPWITTPRRWDVRNK